MSLLSLRDSASVVPRDNALVILGDGAPVILRDVAPVVSRDDVSVVQLDRVKSLCTNVIQKIHTHLSSFRSYADEIPTVSCAQFGPPLVVTSALSVHGICLLLRSSSQRKTGPSIECVNQ